MKPLTQRQVKRLAHCIREQHSISVNCWVRMGTRVGAVEYGSAECNSCGEVAER